jgi:hypothetical protein
MKQVLPATIYKSLIRRVAEEEIKQAGLEDLEACPFCAYVTQMPVGSITLLILDSRVITMMCLRIPIEQI